LWQLPFSGAAKSGAVCGETALVGLTAEALAAALLALPAEDRALLAAMLTGQAEGKG
jgi:hypothetical protein